MDTSLNLARAVVAPGGQAIVVGSTADTREPGSDAADIAASMEEPPRFGALFERHADTIFRYACSRLDLQSADDVVGDTFVEAFRVRHRFSAGHGSSALPWLLGIATNMIKRRRHAEKRWLSGMPHAAARSRESVDDELERVHDRVDAHAHSPWLQSALRQLSTADRDTVLLHVAGGLSLAEVATALGVPLGTVKSRLNRARRALAAELHPSEGNNHV